jgi:hypothetical protein
MRYERLAIGPWYRSRPRCALPVDSIYTATIMREAAKVDNRLTREGVIGRFALDLAVVRCPFLSDFDR